MMRLLIIEDEAKTAREIQRMLDGLQPPTQVVGQLPSIKLAVEWLRQNPMPDLILSDIQLADGLSFEIFKAISVSAPVVFITAFDEYAIKAFDTNGIDYLLKPIDEVRLQQSLDKYCQLQQHFGQPPQQLQQAIAQFLPQHKTILVHSRGAVIPIKTEDISVAYYQNSWVHLILFNGQQYSLHQTMDQLEQQLPPDLFYRANRQFLVHRRAVASAKQDIARKLKLEVPHTLPEAIIVSKAKVTHFLDWWRG